ncbi:MAG: RNA polymerase sigma factor [Bacteroidales bacterium]|jgi:RNA polymerase sigma-70 factor (ECF subfamily)|nr:RNA polymerase sigma factor [Bacteroidales bacterium]
MTDEKQLLSELRDGRLKEKAFGKLVAAYKQQLYWQIRRIVLDHDDADDVLQNAFIKIWKNIDSFREESSLYTWLYRVTTNEALSFMKQKRRQLTTRIEDERDSDYLLNSLHADPYFEGDEVQLKLQEAIALLPEKQRLVFNMRYFENIKYDDMEQILGTSTGALKASFHHAVKKIEDYFNTTD